MQFETVRETITMVGESSIIDPAELEAAKSSFTVLSGKARMQIRRPLLDDGAPVPLTWLDPAKRVPGPQLDFLPLPDDLWKQAVELPDGRFSFPTWVRHLIAWANVWLEEKIPLPERRRRVARIDAGLWGEWVQLQGDARPQWREGAYGRLMLGKAGLLAQLHCIRVDHSGRFTAHGEPDLDPDQLLLPRDTFRAWELQAGDPVLFVRDPGIHETEMVCLRAFPWDDDSTVLACHESITRGQYGDYDGDTVAVICVKSAEAREEILRLRPSLQEIPTRFPTPERRGWTDFGIGLQGVKRFPSSREDPAFHLTVLDKLQRTKYGMGIATLLFNYRVLAARLPKLAFTLGGVMLQATIDKAQLALDIPAIRQLLDDLSDGKAREKASASLLAVAAEQGEEAVRATREGIRILVESPEPFSVLTHPDNLPRPFALTRGGTTLPDLWAFLQTSKDPLQDFEDVLVWHGRRGEVVPAAPPVPISLNELLGDWVTEGPLPCPDEDLVREGGLLAD